MIFQQILFISNIRSWENTFTDYRFALLLLVTLTICVFGVSYLVFRFSRNITKLIIGDDDQGELILNIEFDQILQISIIVIGLCIIIFRFPAFLTSIISVVQAFIFDFKIYKDVILQNTGALVIYVFGLIFVFKSKFVTIWLKGFSK
jgi:hypothetical protein